MDEEKKESAFEETCEKVTEEEEKAPEEPKAEAQEQAGEQESEAAPEEKKEPAKEEEELNAKYMRLMADFQNYKRRTEKEKKDVFSYANEKIVKDLLTVLDNFERALGSECQDTSYSEGMALIFKQLQDVLDKNGLKEIEAVGKEFDPNFHHAVLTDDNSDFGAGCVTEVLQKGYSLHDKVIRPAMVKVNN